MIVDLHTRIWESTSQLGRAADQLRRRRCEPWNRPTASIDDHEAAMKPVACAVILGFESVLLGASIPHEKVAEYVSRDPQKYIGFAGIDPTAGNPVKSLERAVQLGLRGVVISPAAQGFHPAATRAMELFEACEAQGLPIFVEPGVSLGREALMEFSQPALLDEPLRTFANLKLVLGALGHPWVDHGLALIAKHPTVFGDLGEFMLRPWQLYNALLLGHQQGLLNQFVFGSGFPFCSPEKAIITIYSVNTLVQGTHLPSVPREQLRAVVERDTLTLLGLRPALAAAAASPEPSAADGAAGDAGSSNGSSSTISSTAVEKPNP